MNVALTDPENLSRLERLVPLCDSVRKGAEYASALAQATGELLQAATLPNRLDELAPVVKMLSGTSYLPADDVGRELATMTKAGRALEKCVDTENLREARFEVKGAQESLQRVETMVGRAWTARMHAEFGPLQRLAAVLAAIPDTGLAGAELRTWTAEVLQLVLSGPPSAQSIQHFDAARTQLGQRFDALGHLGIDVNVRRFLVEVAGKDATLSNLTPEILEWLFAKNAQSRFRIELR